jgi:hypothetical protein
MLQLLKPSRVFQVALLLQKLRPHSFCWYAVKEMGVVVVAVKLRLVAYIETDADWTYAFDGIPVPSRGSVWKCIIARRLYGEVLLPVPDSRALPQ